MMEISELKTKLSRYGQEHLLRFWPELNAASQRQLQSQLEEIDWEGLQTLIADYVLKTPAVNISGDIQPPRYYPLQPNDEQKKIYVQAQAKGVELLRNGKVAALTVAGGQGTRLGFDGPKGTYPITPVKSKTFFRYFSESLIRLGQKYGKPITWYIMTSLMNDEATRNHFIENNFFGLDPAQVTFFTQGTMPAIGYDGKLLLGAKDSLALAPDGHGGTLLALKRSGALDRMKADGVELISYFQIDNPLVSIANPLFLGLHAQDRSEMSAIMLAKTGPFEKLGNFCMIDGRLTIIEYSDLPEALATQTDATGKLRFIAGSPAIHVISRDFVERLTSGGRLNLPWHRADKKVAFVDAAGTPVNPETANAVKLESFIFDALPLADRTMVMEAAREDEFGPTKNKTGVDSVESCREMMVDRDCRRLELAGVKVSRDAAGKPTVKVELSPLRFVDADDVVEYVKTHRLEIAPNAGEFYLE